MALQQSFEFSESEDGNTLYLTDTTGDYDVTDNPGGYGSPNTERTDLALIAVLNYKDSGGDVEVTTETVDPEDVTEWEYQTLEGDGHYQAKVYAIAKKTGAETPSANDFVYDFTGNELQRWNGSTWVSATSADLSTYDADHTTVNHAHLKDLFNAFNWLNKLFITKQCEPDNVISQYIMETNSMKEGCLSLFTEENYTQFQKNIELYQSRVDSILQLS